MSPCSHSSAVKSNHQPSGWNTEEISIADVNRTCYSQLAEIVDICSEWSEPRLADLIKLLTFSRLHSQEVTVPLSPTFQHHTA
ncbi:hypothetical protein BaRGS_00015691 [Batillaria attramentaria]|uniref:Uncharacterized protein n=1 Tax=Batillaria attramentaria TaxID=370345 RepID=A0ABD0L0T2_9CAEN